MTYIARMAVEFVYFSIYCGHQLTPFNTQCNSDTGAVNHAESIQCCHGMNAPDSHVIEGASATGEVNIYMGDRWQLNTIILLVVRPCILLHTIHCTSNLVEFGINLSVTITEIYRRSESYWGLPFLHDWQCFREQHLHAPRRGV